MAHACNIGFCASWADGITMSICNSIWLQFRLTNIYRLLYLTSSSIFNQQRFRADGILFPNLHKALFVTSYALGQLVVRNSQTKLLCFIGKTWTKVHIGLTFFVLWFFNLSFVNGGLWLKSKQQDTTTILLKSWQLNWCDDIAVTSKQTYFG